MTSRLTIGVSQKVGQPNFGSRGASCQIEFELDSETDPDQRSQLVSRIQDAFRLCHDEVHRELQSECLPTVSSHSEPSARPQSNKPKSDNGTKQSRIREATEAQIRAIHAIASKANVQLTSLLGAEYDVSSPRQLSIRQASELIETLKSRLPSE